MPINVTRFKLQASANPVFTVYNPSALDSYMDQVGGYAVADVNGTTFAAKLDKKTWTKFADGTPVEDASKFETMVHIPRLYFKANRTSIQLSPVELPEFNFFDSPEWIAAYKLSFDGSLPHSHPGVILQRSKSVREFWNEAQLLGENWGLANYQFHCQINALFQARFGNLNSQKVIGAGFQSQNWEAARDLPMGLLIGLGDGSGNVTFESEALGVQHPVKLFGFEDLWGKLWEVRPGIRFEMRDNVRYAIIYPGNIVSNTANGREFICNVQTANDLYIKEMELGDYWDTIPQVTTQASAFTYYCDGFFSSTAGQIMLVGGYAEYGLHCGLTITSTTRAFNTSSSSVCARLAFYGSPTIIPGAEFVQLLNSRRSTPTPVIPDAGVDDESSEPESEILDTEMSNER